MMHKVSCAEDKHDNDNYRCQKRTGPKSPLRLLLGKTLIYHYDFFMIKKHCISTLIASLIFLTAQASFGASGFGAGILLGSPSAISGKYWLNSKTAIDAGLSFGLSQYYTIYSDYLLHFPGGFGSRDHFVSQLIPYIGVGGVLGIVTEDRATEDNYVGKKSGSAGLGVRVPIGIEWKSQQPSLGVFVEIAPGLSIMPKTDMFVNGGVGIRYYF